jgi:nucleotide-binding universal stress UspA family protein
VPSAASDKAGLDVAQARSDVAFGTPAVLPLTLRKPRLADRRDDEAFTKQPGRNVVYDRILVPVDGSPTSNVGLKEAIRLAQLTRGRLRLLHIIDVLSLAIAAEGYVLSSGELMESLRKNGEALVANAARTVEASGVPVETSLVDNLSGRVADLVAEDVAGWKADIVVLGTHGRRGIGRVLLGSDAEQIVRTSAVPVLLVRGAAKG